MNRSQLSRESKREIESVCALWGRMVVVGIFWEREHMSEGKNNQFEELKENQYFRQYQKNKAGLSTRLQEHEQHILSNFKIWGNSSLVKLFLKFRCWVGPFTISCLFILVQVMQCPVPKLYLDGMMLKLTIPTDAKHFQLLSPSYRVVAANI